MFRPLIIFLLFCAMLNLNALSQMSYRERVQLHRDTVDAEFADTSRSILHHADIAHFHGLEYFEVNENYRVKAKFRSIKNGKVVIMKTSGSRTPSYRPYGTLSFKLNGKKLKLTLYQNADPNRPELKNYLLLAFTDRTNGFETYGGGRYIEYMVSDVSPEMIVDFNYCFNPYCAYTDGYNCVIPPAENFLDTRIEAGVKKYHD